jgi:hypothetical protein
MRGEARQHVQAFDPMFRLEGLGSRRSSVGCMVQGDCQGLRPARTAAVSV